MTDAGRSVPVVRGADVQARISQVRFIAFDEQRAGRRWSRLLALADGVIDRGGATFRGFGERTLGAAGVAAPRSVLARLDSELVSSLSGRTLELGDRQATATWLLDVTSPIAARIGQPVAAVLETALLDLVARMLGRPFAACLVDGPVAPPPIVESVPGRLADVDALSQAVAGVGCIRPWLRLRVTGQLADDARLLAAGLRGVDSEALEGLWLDLGGRRSTGATEHLLADLSALAVAGGLPPQILVDFGPTTRDELRELQARCHGISGASSPSGRRTDVRPVVRTNTSEEPLRHAALLVHPDREPGPQAAIAAAERALRLNPETPLMVAPSRRAGQLESWMVHHVAASLPGVHYLVRPAPRTHGQGVAVPPVSDYEQDPEHRELPTGLCPEVDLTAVLGRFRGYRSLPPPEVRPEAQDVQYYDTSRLRPLAKYTIDNHHLERECLARGLIIDRRSSRAFMASDLASGRTVAFDQMAGHLNAEVAHTLARDKGLTRRLLDAVGVAVPVGADFHAGDTAGCIDYVRSIGYPVVVKPAAGAMGTDVTTDVRDERDLRAALERVARGRFASSGVVIERFVEGRDYRAYVVNGQVISLVERLPGHVVGDGANTVVELALAKNEERVASNPYLGRRLLRIDTPEQQVLRRAGHHPGSVPAADEVVRLSFASNLTRGGDSREVLDETHPENLTLIGRAADAVPGLRHGGVDVIMHDHREAPTMTSFAIIEINFNAEFSLHHYPRSGPRRNVARRIVRLHLEAEGIPIPRPRRHLTVELRITGAVQGVGFRRWLAKHAERSRLDGWVANRNDGSLAAVLSGTTGRVSALTSLSATGPKGARVRAVRTTPIERSVAAGFRIERGRCG